MIIRNKQDLYLLANRLGNMLGYWWNKRCLYPKESLTSKRIIYNFAWEDGCEFTEAEITTKIISGKYLYLDLIDYHYKREGSFSIIVEQHFYNKRYQIKERAKKKAAVRRRRLCHCQRLK